MSWQSFSCSGERSPSLRPGYGHRRAGRKRERDAAIARKKVYGVECGPAGGGDGGMKYPLRLDAIRSVGRRKASAKDQVELCGG